MNIEVGQIFTVKSRGNDPFDWNFDRLQETIKVIVIEPDQSYYTLYEMNGVVWDNPYHGFLVLVKDAFHNEQWVPVDALNPLEENSYKVGNRVIVKENKYYSGLLDVSRVGTLAYVTDVLDHGCQLALDPDCDPDEHSKRSLFFGYEEFERYEE